MAKTFQIKRGAKATMPNLAQGELGFVTDANAEEVHIGTGARNIQIVTLNEDGKVPSEQMPVIGPVVPRMNLLDNPRFKVNQKGLSSYTTSEIGEYTVDRWYGSAAGSVITLSDDHITVGGGLNKGLRSHIANMDEMLDHIGETFTMSILDYDGTLVTTQFEMKSGVYADVTNGVYRFGVEHDAGVDIDAFFRCATTTEINPKAIKLELGEDQTLAYQDADGNWQLYSDYDYVADLAACTVNHYTIEASRLGKEFVDGIGAASVQTMTTSEYEALENKNASTLYMLTDADEESGAADLIAEHNSDTEAHQDIRDYVDSLASNYDPAGSADTAETNAKEAAQGYANTAEANAIAHADSLAGYYDPVGSADSAESNANSHTDRVLEEHNSSEYSHQDIRTIIVNHAGDGMVHLPDASIATPGTVLTAVEGIPTWSTPPSGIPECTHDDNGKFLRVVDGVAAWETIPSAESASF